MNWFNRLFKKNKQLPLNYDIDKDLNTSFLRIDKETNMLKWCVASIKDIQANGGGGNVDLSNYYNKQEIDSKVGGLQNTINTNYNEFVDENTKTNEKIKEIESKLASSNSIIDIFNKPTFANKKTIKNEQTISWWLSGSDYGDFILGKKFIVYRVSKGDANTKILEKEGIILSKTFYPTYQKLLMQYLIYGYAPLNITLDTTNNTFFINLTNIDESEIFDFEWEYASVNSIGGKDSGGNVDLSNYYNKQEIDTKLTNDYYTKATIDNKLYNDYYTKTNIDSKLRDYLSKNNFNTIIQDYTTKNMVDNKLNGYYTKQEVDDKIANIPSGGGGGVSFRKEIKEGQVSITANTDLIDVIPLPNGFSDYGDKKLVGLKIIMSLATTSGDYGSNVFYQIDTNWDLDLLNTSIRNGENYYVNTINVGKYIQINIDKKAGMHQVKNKTDEYITYIRYVWTIKEG